MKKVSVILLLLLSLGLVACGEVEIMSDPNYQSQPAGGTEQAQSAAEGEAGAATAADTENGSWLAQFVSAEEDGIRVYLSAQPMGGAGRPEGFEPPEGAEPGQMPEGFELPEGAEPGQMPEGFELPEGAEPGQMPEGFEPPEGVEPGERPEGGRGGFGRNMTFAETESFYSLAEGWTLLIDGEEAELSQLAEGDLLNISLVEGQVTSIIRMQLPQFGEAPEEETEEAVRE